MALTNSQSKIVLGLGRWSFRSLCGVLTEMSLAGVGKFLCVDV